MRRIAIQRHLNQMGTGFLSRRRRAGQSISSGGERSARTRRSGVENHDHFEENADDTEAPRFRHAHRADQIPRAAPRGGKGSGCKLREDDIGPAVFLTSTHWLLLFFTIKGRVLPSEKAYTSCRKAPDSETTRTATCVSLDGDDQTIAVD